MKAKSHIMEIFDVKVKLIMWCENIAVTAALAVVNFQFSCMNFAILYEHVLIVVSNDRFPGDV